MRSLLFLFLFFAMPLAFADGFDYSTEESCLANDYVAQWGRLKLVGNQLSAENGDPIQLRGWSSHGYAWTGQYYDDKEDLRATKKFGANVFRIAMYVQEWGQYQNKPWVQDCIDWTAELGMYCVFDWHCLTPGDPNKYLIEGGLTDANGVPVDAEEFFEWVTSYVAEKNYKHVLYEICNEPNGVGWSDVKRYADRIIPIIEENDPGSIVLVGTPNWCQNIHEASSSPITQYNKVHIMYSFHFYAGAHIGLISRLKTEVAKIPLFVDEWGTTDHTGHGDLYLENTYKFIEVMNGFNDGDVKLSWCNWSWSNDDGSGACTSAGNYTENTLSPSGKYLMKTLRAGGIPADWNPDDEEEENGTPYGGTPMEIGEKAISDLWLEYYNEGGEGVAYHDNNPSWEYDATKDHGGGCNTGILTTDFRIDECIDVFKMNADELKYYGNKDKAEIFGIGYVDANEWVKYTVDVKRTGFYHVIPYANAYPGSANEISMTVAGKNILRNRNNLSDASVSTVSMKPSDEIYDNNQGYNSYKWTYLHRNETRYGVWLDKGIRTIKIQFGACSGLGSLRFEFDPSTEVGIANVQPGLFGIYPNPTSGGAFTVSLSGHEAGFAAITICNLNGQAVYRTSISTGREMLRPFLPSGIYLITVKTNEQSQTQKLIIP